MVAYPWGALITGILLVLSGVVCLIRHFLLEPENEHYPKAPVFVRHAMFGFAAICLFIGLQFIWVFFMDHRMTSPPQPSPSMQLISVALLIYNATLLGNILSQRYPETIWIRLNRINDTLRCKDKPPLWGWFSR